MGYYEEKKKELDDLFSTVRKEKAFFESAAKQERENLDKQKEGIIQMAKERQIGFPWLAKAYDELFQLDEFEVTNFLTNKSHPAISAAKIIKEQSRLRRQAEREKKIAQYIVEYYENIAPFLIDLKEEVDIANEKERELLKEYSAEELEDSVTNYLTKEEYRKLPSIERNQIALDRFWSRPKSKWLIGRLYERYIGYLYEKEGYNVEYVGIFKGFEDLGRDLICQKGNDFIVIQCKYWSQFRTIYEKHIFQFFGTVFQYKDENPSKNIHAIFYTSTELSKLARRFACELGIELKENFEFDKDYPCIKCHTSKINGTKIYHLPFDQQYDKTKLEKKYGEFYCKTVQEAEEVGFRRAFRYRAK
ncbi:MAG: restriction endonuclease [Sedimentisphaerales bacterium]|nr:restriction endonuclease [Sedimentisphaerales bacterium]